MIFLRLLLFFCVHSYLCACEMSSSSEGGADKCDFGRSSLPSHSIIRSPDPPSVIFLGLPEKDIFTVNGCQEDLPDPP